MIAFALLIQTAKCEQEIATADDTSQGKVNATSYFKQNYYLNVTSGDRRYEGTYHCHRYYINHCVFRGFRTNNEYGGAVNIVHEDESLLVIHTVSFILCSCKVGGGAVCFFDKGSCIFYKVCALQCRIVSEWIGHFAYVTASDDVNHFNVLKEVSICYCGGEELGNDAIDVRYGVYSIYSINATENKCISNSCISLHATVSDKNISKISFSNFANCESSSVRCLCLYKGSYCFKNCNVVYNVQLGTSSVAGVIFVQEGTASFIECNVMHNSGDPIYHVYWWGKLDLQNCTSDSRDYTGNVLFSRIGDKSIQNDFKFTETSLCMSFVSLTLHPRYWKVFVSIANAGIGKKFSDHEKKNPLFE